MDENICILERIGNFYAGLEHGEWIDFFSRKPEGFDNMEFNERMHYTLDMMVKINDIMEDIWQVMRVWSRRKYIKNPKYSTIFDTFMEYELNYLKQKEIQEQKNQNSEKKHFWNWLCK